MRKFKFVGTEKERLDYSLNESQRPIYGKVYDEYHVVGGFNPLDWIDDRLYGHEWEEVFDTIEDKITELKELAKSQGMDCEVVLKETDIWDGVEYVQYISPTSSCTTQWKTYKVKHITQRSVWIEIDDNGSTTTSLLIEKCKPSTESAYVEHLKKKAFELYGEIREGDRFEKDFGFYREFKIGDIKNHWGFEYRKGNDTLMYRGLTIYEAGQWAKKLPKKIEVIASGYDVNHYPNHSCFRVEFFIYNDNDRDYSNKEITSPLAKQLETYLNENK